MKPGSAATARRLLLLAVLSLGLFAASHYAQDQWVSATTVIAGFMALVGTLADVLSYLSSSSPPTVERVTAGNPVASTKSTPQVDSISRIRGRYFVGRERDVENLVGLIDASPVVWLIGDSGAGKSSLLRRGLLPRLNGDGRYLAVLVDRWGSDWEAGPARELSWVLARLAEDERVAGFGRLKPKKKNADALDTLIDVAQAMGRIPILLLDQYDDYLLLHRQRFVRAGQPLDSDSLCAQNAFWRRLSGLVRENRLRLLASVRSDAQWGLRAIDFARSEPYLLPTLDRPVVEALFNEVVVAPLGPEDARHAELLRQRLMGDLGEHILPIQMEMAFEAVAPGGRLDRRIYLEHGLAGLESRYIEGYVTDVASQVGMPVRTLLQVLVQFASGEPEGATARTLTNLVGATDIDAQRHGDALERAMRALGHADILREVVQESTGETRWTLHHAYLRRGIREFDRRRNPWQRFLEDSARDFAQAKHARGWWSCWRRLLGPVDQARIVWACWWKKEVAYGPNRGYAWLSTLRLAVWVGAFAAVGWVGRTSQLDHQAEQILAPMGSLPELTWREKQALAELSVSGEGVRQRVIDMALASPEKAHQFIARSDALVVASSGLDDRRRSILFDDTFDRRCSGRQQATPEEWLACIALSEHSRSRRKQGFVLLLALLDQQSAWGEANFGPELRARAQDLLERLAHELDDEEARQVCKDVLDALERMNKVDQARLALGVLASRLAPQEQAAFMDRVVTVLESAPSVQWGSQVLGLLPAHAERLQPNQAARAIGVALRLVEGDPDSPAADSLLGSAGHLWPRLAPQNVKELGPRLGSVLRRASSADQRVALLNRICHFRPLADEAMLVLLGEVLDAEGTRSSRSEPLYETCLEWFAAAAPDRLSDRGRKAATLLRSGADPAKKRWLTRVLALAPNQDPSMRLATVIASDAQRLVHARPNENRAWGDSVSEEAAKRLSANQSAAVAGGLLSAFEQAPRRRRTATYELDSTLAVLLGRPLPAAVSILDRLLARSTESLQSRRGLLFPNAIRAIIEGNRIRSPQVGRQIVALIQLSENDDSELGKAFVAATTGLPPSESATLLRHLLSLLESECGGSSSECPLVRFAEAHSAGLWQQLPPRYAREIAEAFLEASKDQVSLRPLLRHAAGHLPAPELAQATALYTMVGVLTSTYSDTWLASVRQLQTRLGPDTRAEFQRELLRALKAMPEGGLGFRQLIETMRAVKEGGVEVSPELADFLFGALQAARGRSSDGNRRVDHGMALAAYIALARPPLRPDAARFVEETILRALEEAYDGRSIGTLTQALERLGDSKPDAAVEQAVEEALQRADKGGAAPCRPTLPLVRRIGPADAVRVLGSPMCSAADRDLLLERLSEVHREDFGKKTAGRYLGDVWKFVRWAHQTPLVKTRGQQAGQSAGVR